MSLKTEFGYIPDPKKERRSRPCSFCGEIIEFIGRPKDHPRCPVCFQYPIKDEIDLWHRLCAEVENKNRKIRRRPSNRHGR